MTTPRRPRRRWLIAAVLAPVSVGVPALAAPGALPSRVPANGLTAVELPVAEDAAAVLVNIAMTDATSSGYVTADRCDSLEPGPQARSSGNYSAGTIVSNVSVVRAEAREICIANQAPVNLVVDVQGWFGPPAPGGTALLATPSRRVLDTREGTGVRPGTLWITPVDTGAAPGSRAVLANIATVDATSPGYVTADRCTTLTAGPQQRANGNYSAREVVANLSVVPVDPDGRFCIFTLTPVHLVVDIQGELVDPSTGGLAFTAVDPVRLADTRIAGGLPAAGSIERVETGLGGASAALVNIAMIDGGAPGYVTSGRCSELIAGPQQRADGNHRAGGVVSNLSVVPLDEDGSFCIYRQSPVHLAVDLQGAFGSGGTQLWFPMEPVRVLDTRPPGGEPTPTIVTTPPTAAPPATAPPAAVPPPPPGTPRTSCRSVVHLGDSTSVGMISASMIPEAAGRLDAQYRRVGVTDPRMEISGARSIVETLRGQVNARDAAAQVRARGYRGCWVFALGTTDTANLALSPGGVSRRERIDRMMTVAAGEPVLWVNTRTIVTRGEWSNPWMQLWNQELRAAQSRWPNLEIYDWASAVQSAWFSGDGIHYTSDGYRWRAILIANALASRYPA